MTVPLFVALAAASPARAQEAPSTPTEEAEPEPPAPEPEPEPEPEAEPEAEPDDVTQSDDPRKCFPVVTGQRRFRCGTTTGRIWGVVATGSQLRGVLRDMPEARQHVVLADALKVTGTVANTTAGVVSAVVVYNMLRAAIDGSSPEATLGIEELVVMVGGSLVGSAANRAATVQLENAIDSYNLAARAGPRLGVAPGAVAGVDGQVVPTLGATLRW